MIERLFLVTGWFFIWIRSKEQLQLMIYFGTSLPANN